MGIAASAETHAFRDALSQGRVADILEAVNKNTQLAKGHIDEDGGTAWHLLAREGKLEIMQLIFEAMMTRKGAKPTYRSDPSLMHATAAQMLDRRNTIGQTPLMLACMHDHPKCVAWLLTKGADPWSKSDEVAGQLSALHYAVRAGSAACTTSLLAFVDAHEVYRRPRAGCRFADIKTISAFTALHFAAWYDRKDLVSILANHGASLTCQCLYWQVHKSAVDGQCEEMNMRHGSTPLHVAARFGRGGVIIELLIAHVAQSPSQSRANDPRLIRDSHHELPFNVAMQYRQYSIVRWLMPGTALQDIAEAADPAERVMGPLKLIQIVAPVAQQRLLTIIELLDRQAQQAKANAESLVRGPDSSSLSSPPPGRTGSGASTGVMADACSLDALPLGECLLPLSLSNVSEMEAARSPEAERARSPEAHTSTKVDSTGAWIEEPDNVHYTGPEMFADLHAIALRSRSTVSDALSDKPGPSGSSAAEQRLVSYGIKAKAKAYCDALPNANVYSHALDVARVKHLTSGIPLQLLAPSAGRAGHVILHRSLPSGIGAAAPSGAPSGGSSGKDIDALSLGLLHVDARVQSSVPDVSGTGAGAPSSASVDDVRSLGPLHLDAQLQLCVPNDVSKAEAVRLPGSAWAALPARLHPDGDGGRVEEPDDVHCSSTMFADLHALSVRARGQGASALPDKLGQAGSSDAELRLISEGLMKDCDALSDALPNANMYSHALDVARVKHLTRGIPLQPSAETGQTTSWHAGGLPSRGAQTAGDTGRLPWPTVVDCEAAPADCAAAAADLQQPSAVTQPPDCNTSGAPSSAHAITNAAAEPLTNARSAASVAATTSADFTTSLSIPSSSGSIGTSLASLSLTGALLPVHKAPRLMLVRPSSLSGAVADSSTSDAAPTATASASNATQTPSDAAQHSRGCLTLPLPGVRGYSRALSTNSDLTGDEVTWQPLALGHYRASMLSLCESMHETTLSIVPPAALTAAAASQQQEDSSGHTVEVTKVPPAADAASTSVASVSDSQGHPAAPLVACMDILKTAVAEIFDQHGNATTSEDLDSICAVCMDNAPQFLVFQPCKHRTCLSCCRELVQLHKYEAALCPFCRRVILGFVLP